MASTKVIDGKDLVVLIDGKAVAHATSHSLKVSREDRTFTSKDTGDFESSEPGKGSAEMSGNALVFYDTGVSATDPTFTDRSNVNDLYTLLRNATTCTFKFTTQVSGDKEFTADGYFKELSINSPNAGENADYSFTIKITEWPTLAAIV